MLRWYRTLQPLHFALIHQRPMPLSSISFRNAYVGRNQSNTHVYNEHLYAIMILCMWAPHSTYCQRKNTPEGIINRRHQPNKQITTISVTQTKHLSLKYIFLASQRITIMGHAHLIEKLYLLYLTISCSFPTKHGHSFTHCKEVFTLELMSQGLCLLQRDWIFWVEKNQIL